MTCDPAWGDVTLLLTCDGTNGSTAFPDSSSYANVMTATNATVETANVKFGTGAANSVGGSAVGTPISTNGPLDLLSGSEDWTVEGWVYAASGSTSFISDCANPNSGASTNGWFIRRDVGTGTLAAFIEIAGVSHGISSGTGLLASTWQHFALVRQSGNFCLFLDGVAGAINSISTVGFVPPANRTFFILFVNVGFDAFDSITGQVDEVRITNGFARYTPGVDFTPPSTAFGIGLCSVTVPDVVGETLANATSDIIAADLIVGTVTLTVDMSVPIGNIISQFPIGGTLEAPGSAVDLVESAPVTVTVPNIVNTSIVVVAPGILAAVTLVIGTVSYAHSGIIIAGNIISQSPAAGASVFAGSAVNVVVSSGLPSLLVPDLFGLTQTDAIALLLSLGLVPGAIGSAPSQFVPPGEVQLQNPSAGTPVAAGAVVSFVLSLGTLATSTLFDFEATVISQYANSPTILQLVNNLNLYIDQSVNFANFFNFVWNVDTAVGFGLDIWGKIVNVPRLLYIPTTVDYVGFYMPSESQPLQDWTPMGSDQPPQPAVGGAMYTGYNATFAYLLPDDAYRQLILAKAFANICITTAPAINQILQNLYGPGTAFVLNTGTMTISYNLTFVPTAIQLAILEQSGVIPTPPGVLATINTGV